MGYFNNAKSIFISNQNENFLHIYYAKPIFWKKMFKKIFILKFQEFLFDVGILFLQF